MTDLERELCESLFAELEPLHAPLCSAAHLCKRAAALGDREARAYLAPLLAQRMDAVAVTLSRYPPAVEEATLAALGTTGPVFAACRAHDPAGLVEAVARAVRARAEGR